MPKVKVIDWSKLMPDTPEISGNYIFKLHKRGQTSSPDKLPLPRNEMRLDYKQRLRDIVNGA